MAKGKSFFGLKRGSTKSLTFQVLNGAQVVKDRVFEVKNPRTNSQMIQRMCIATATAAYTHMREICDHSFEGVSYGQRSMAEFISLNVRNLLADVKAAAGQFSYNPYQDRNLYVSPFILSRGTLKFPTSGLVFSQENGYVTIELPYPDGITDESRTPDFFDALHMRLGDLLTFPFIYQGTSANDWRFGWLRARYAHEANMEVGDADWTDCFDFECSLVYNACYSQGGKVKFIVQLPAPMGDYAFGTAILSRHANNKWLRSTAAINIGNSPINDPSANTALATYPTGTDYILNGANIGGSGIVVINVTTNPGLPWSGSLNPNLLFNVPVSFSGLVEHLEVKRNGNWRKLPFDAGLNQLSISEGPANFIIQGYNGEKTTVPSTYVSGGMDLGIQEFRYN